MDRLTKRPSERQLQSPQNQIAISHEGPCVARGFPDSDYRNHTPKKDPYPIPRLRDLPLEAVVLQRLRYSLCGLSKVLSFSSSLMSMGFRSKIRSRHHFIASVLDRA